MKKAGVPVIRLHDLRHTHATLALSAGVHPKVVSERLGHANIGITLDTTLTACPLFPKKRLQGGGLGGFRGVMTPVTLGLKATIGCIRKVHALKRSGALTHLVN